MRLSFIWPHSWPFLFLPPASYIRGNIEGTLNPSKPRLPPASRRLSTSTSEVTVRLQFPWMKITLVGPVALLASKIAADKNASFHLSYQLPVYDSSIQHLRPQAIGEGRCPDDHHQARPHPRSVWAV